MTVAAIGTDTIVINDGIADRVMSDFGDGDVAIFTFPNTEVEAKQGKNGNVIYAANETGSRVDVELRILVGSSDDKFLNSLKLAMKEDLPSFPLLSLNFTKRVGDGQTNVNDVVYTMNGGVFQQGVDTKSNAEGDTEQAISLYRLIFFNNKRSL